MADLDTVADEPVIDESTLIEDSTETKKDSTPSLEIPPRRDMTYDAVMNRMRTSPDWSKYQQGILPKMRATVWSMPTVCSIIPTTILSWSTRRR